MLIIMFSESISTFPETSLQHFCIWTTNLFCLTGWSGTGLMCFKSIPALEMVFLIHRDIASPDAAFCGFPWVTKNCLISCGTSSLLISVLAHSTSQSLGFPLNLWYTIAYSGRLSLVCLSENFGSMMSLPS